jgi:hypothetical protein
MNKKTACLLSFVFFITISGCTTFGAVSRSYNYSKQQIWNAITVVLSTNHGGVKRVEQEPPTAISNLSVKDKKFGIDKSAYQAFTSLSGFTRPYVVDIEVRVYPTGEESTDYSRDNDKAEQIQNEISKYLYDKRYNSSLQDTYVPY